jgi:hypothetical protein
VQKHRAIMMGKMYFQLVVLCLAVQLLLLPVLIPLRVNVAYQMVPAPHREVALEVARRLAGTGFFLGWHLSSALREGETSLVIRCHG